MTRLHTDSILEHDIFVILLSLLFYHDNIYDEYSQTTDDCCLMVTALLIVDYKTKYVVGFEDGNYGKLS